MSRVEEDGRFRERVCAWLRLNGVDPGTIPLGAEPNYAGGVLTIDQWVYKDEHVQIDPEDPGRTLTRAVQFPVRVEPAGLLADVAEWLMPQRWRCGQ